MLVGLAVQQLHSSHSSHWIENDGYFLSTCNVISLCPGWQMETQNSLLFAVMVLHGLSWPVRLQCELWQSSLSSPLPLLCVCLHRPTSMAPLTLGYLSLLLVGITKLSVLHGGALTFTPSYPILQNPPSSIWQFKFFIS